MKNVNVKPCTPHVNSRLCVPSWQPPQSIGIRLDVVLFRYCGVKLALTNSGRKALSRFFVKTKLLRICSYCTYPSVEINFFS